MPLVQEGWKEVVVRDEEEWIQWQESISCCSKEPSSTQFLFHTQIRRSRERERDYSHQFRRKDFGKVLFTSCDKECGNKLS